MHAFFKVESKEPENEYQSHEITFWDNSHAGGGGNQKALISVKIPYTQAFLWRDLDVGLRAVAKIMNMQMYEATIYQRDRATGRFKAKLALCSLEQIESIEKLIDGLVAMNIETPAQGEPRP